MGGVLYLLWIFAILGLVSLTSALCGLSASWGRGGRMLTLHLAAFALLVVAWAAEHTTATGWAALGVAAALELVDRWLWLFSRRVRGRATSPVVARSAAGPTKMARLASVGAPAGTGKPAASRAAKEAAATVAPDVGAARPDAESSMVEPRDSAPTEQARALPELELEKLPAGEASPIHEAPTTDAGPISHSRETQFAEAEQFDGGTSAPDEPQIVQASAISEDDVPTDLSEGAPTEAPADVPSPVPSISTIVLLRTRYDVAPGVFHASLRRSGQRDAQLVEAPEAAGETWIQAGPITLKLRTENGPCDPAMLEAALGSTADWPEAADLTADHEAHIVVTSEYLDQTPRDDVIRLLHRAHAALAEFAPAVAVVWVAAERLVRADELSNLSATAADLAGPLAETCVQFRVFALSEPNESLFLTDCVGLHAFGLPDIQFITKGEPPETVIQTLRGLAERFVTAGCDVADESAFEMSDGETWRATHARGAFPPDREVIQITVKR